MAWVLVSPHNRRRAAFWAVAGAGALIALGAISGLAIAPGAVFWGSVGFVSFLLCEGQALKALRVDEMVFDGARRPVRTASRGSASVLEPLRPPRREIRRAPARTKDRVRAADAGSR